MANNTDFLRFSAYSMKDLITKKLSQDTAFTDQIYPGSNMSILIDIISYMYQCIVYLLNNAAAESMFADTQIYENINRLVKLVGYNPKGIIPSSANFYIDNRTNKDEGKSGGKYRQYIIPKYACIDTGVIDAIGNPVYYSIDKSLEINDDIDFEFKLINGKWEYYNNPLVADGIEYETFILTGLKSDIINKGFVGNNYIDVYIQRGNNYTQYIKSDIELFANINIGDVQNFSKIYNKYTKIYSIRLNENKEYEIKFGNGINGEKLEKGDILHIFYLNTNGIDGKITFDSYDGKKKFQFNSTLLGVSEELWTGLRFNYKNSITSLPESEDPTVLRNPDVKLGTESTDALQEESVESIRQNAPTWFKVGNKLITHDDFVYYFKNMHVGELTDIICQNNYEYVSTFYKWLYDLGVNNHGNPQYYLNSSTLLRNNLKYADPADANNVYLWVKLFNSNLNQSIQSEWINDIWDKKLLTTEVSLLDAIEVNFAICAAPIDIAKTYFEETTGFDENNETYLEITVNDNNIYNSAQIKDIVLKIMTEYFEPNNLTLGMSVNYNNIYNEILSINGVQNIRTIWVSKDDKHGNRPRILDGLSFATWSTSVVDKGDDLDIGNTNKTLQKFQFPKLYNKSLIDKIKIVKKSINTVNKIQF